MTPKRVRVMFSFITVLLLSPLFGKETAFVLPLCAERNGLQCPVTPLEVNPLSPKQMLFQSQIYLRANRAEKTRN